MTGAGESLLCGRGDELTVLTGALDDVRRRVGASLLVEGEAGIGKTRLLDEVSARARALGVEVRRGSAEELEQARPFGPLLEALGAPDSLPRLDDEAWPNVTDARFLTQDAYVDHVERLTSAGPMLLAVDDLHWGDRATLATLWALARRSPELGLLLVLAFRPSPQSTELARVVIGCRELGACHLQLHAIDDAAICALAGDVVGGSPGPGLLEELRGAGGNPFLAIELLRALETDGGLVDRDGVRELSAEGLSAPLRDTLLRRMTAMSDDARRLLSVAAVLGGAGRLEDLAAVLGVSVADAGAAVAEATRAGLLEPAGEVVAFRHDLIREALYDDLPEAVRAGWHREAARRLDGRAEPVIVARHLALGAAPGDHDAVDGLRRVAHELSGREPDAAAELLERAIALEPEVAAGADLAVERAEALLAAGRAEDAGAQADAVVAASDASPAALARAFLARGESCSHQGRLGEAVEAFAAARATGALDEATAAYAVGRQAENRVWTFALGPALDEAEEALAHGRRLGITAVTVEALATRCAVHEFRAEFDASIAAGTEAVRLAGDDADALRRTPHAYLGLALLAADRLDDARAVAEEGRRRSTELGQVLVLPNYQALLVRIAWFAGRWDDAIAEADTAADLAADFGLRFGAGANDGVRGLIALHRGDLGGVRAIVAGPSGDARGDGDDASGSELGALLRARLFEADGDVGAAAATLLGLFEVERALGMDAPRLWPGPACVRLALAAGDETAARGVAADLEAIAARASTASAQGAAAFARGLVERDAAGLDEAAAAFGIAGRPLDQLEALEAAGGAHASAGERDDAVTALEAALAIADRLGAAYDGRRVGAALRDLGVRASSRQRKQRAATGWDALTGAELEVARLVGEGLRNAEIAEQLFVSRRTVESHVSHLYAKLGVSTRVALANLVRERHRVSD